MLFHVNSGPKFWPRPEFGPFFSKKARIRPKFLEQSPTWATNLQNNRSFIIYIWFSRFLTFILSRNHLLIGLDLFLVKLAVFIGNSDQKNQYLEKKVLSSSVNIFTIIWHMEGKIFLLRSWYLWGPGKNFLPNKKHFNAS